MSGTTILLKILLQICSRWLVKMFSLQPKTYNACHLSSAKNFCKQFRNLDPDQDWQKSGPDRVQTVGNPKRFFRNLSILKKINSWQFFWKFKPEGRNHKYIKGKGLFLFYLFFTSQSTIFQLCRDGASCVEIVLSKNKCVLLKDTTQQHWWSSNPRLLESNTLPLSHCAP